MQHDLPDVGDRQNRIRELEAKVQYLVDYLDGIEASGGFTFPDGDHWLPNTYHVAQTWLKGDWT